ncbi:MAG: hypothetical protein R3E97_24890 [Candidatus Eisenbacteria bacterium]|jgi:hypothetical protein
MKKKLLLGALLALPLAVVGLTSGQSHVSASQPEQSGYICPLTGEELPCPGCCPLNGKADDALAASAKVEGATAVADTEGYICPLTGEELPCPDCCPAKGK